MQIRMVAPGETPSLRIRLGPLARPEMVGWTNMLGRTHEVTLSLQNIVRAADRNYPGYRARGWLAPTLSLNDYAAMLTELTALHEIGHALGLGHPVPSTNHNPVGNFAVVLPDVPNASAPSVMVGEHSMYFLMMYTMRNRAVGMADIRASPRDIQAVNLMWDGGRPAPGASSHSCVMPEFRCTPSR